MSGLFVFYTVLSFRPFPTAIVASNNKRVPVISTEAQHNGEILINFCHSERSATESKNLSNSVISTAAQRSGEIPISLNALQRSRRISNPEISPCGRNDNTNYNHQTPGSHRAVFFQ